VFSGFLELHGRPPLCRRPLVAGGIAMLGDIPLHGDRDGAGEKHEGPHPAQLRRAPSGGVPKGAAPDEAGGEVPPAGRPFRGHLRRFLRDRREEERGQGQAIAENLMELSALRTPASPFSSGRGERRRAGARRGGPRCGCWKTRSIRSSSPEGLRRHPLAGREKGAEAAENLKLTAADVGALGVAERVIPELEGKLGRRLGIARPGRPAGGMKDVRALPRRSYPGALPETARHGTPPAPDTAENGAAGDGEAPAAGWADKMRSQKSQRTAPAILAGSF
jgi:hypothetical protein